MSEPILEKVEPGTHRQLGVDLFNHVWTLLETAERTPAQDTEMVHAAHASCFHWSRAGEAFGAEQQAVGEWQCSRVYAVLGRPEPALDHARACLQIADTSDVPDWVRAAALEALARADHVAADAAAYQRHLAEARRATAAIEEEDDREVIAADLDQLEQLAGGAKPRKAGKRGQ